MWRATASARAPSPTRSPSLRRRSGALEFPRLGLPAPTTACRPTRRCRAPHDHAVASGANAFVQRAAAHPAHDRCQRHHPTRAAVRGWRRLLGRARKCRRHGRADALAGGQRLPARLDCARDRRICRARRGILDLFAPGMPNPVRLDFSATRSDRSAPSIRIRSAPSANCARSTSCR